MIKENIGYSIEMQELSMTYPTRTQIKRKKERKQKKDISCSFHAVYVCVPA